METANAGTAKESVSIFEADEPKPRKQESGSGGTKDKITSGGGDGGGPQVNEAGKEQPKEPKEKKKEKEQPEEKKTVKAKRVTKDKEGKESVSEYDIDDDDEFELDENTKVKAKDVREYYSNRSKHEETEKKYKEYEGKAKFADDFVSGFDKHLEKVAENPKDMVYYMAHHTGRDGAELYSQIEDSIMKDLEGMYEGMEDMTDSERELLLKSRMAERKLARMGEYKSYGEKIRTERELSERISKQRDEFVSKHGEDMMKLAFKSIQNEIGDKMYQMPPEDLFKNANERVLWHKAGEEAEKLLEEFDGEFDDADGIYRKLASRIKSGDFLDNADAKEWLKKATKSYRAKQREAELKK